MGANSELIKQLRSGRSRFFLADFHVHSPASFDVRSANRIADLPKALQEALVKIPDGLNNRDYEKAVISAYPPERFLTDLAAQRDAVIGETEPGNDSDWGIIGITDHNVCAYSCALASLAYAKSAEHRLIVLPGVELDVVYKIPSTGSSAQIHILCLFEPGTTDAQLGMAVRDARDGRTWEVGTAAEVDSLCDFVRKLRGHREWPATCIAAHVGSGKGAQRETRNTILSHIDAELSRLEGERASGREPDLRAIDARIAHLDTRRQPDSVATEVLKVIGECGFDALQVASTTDSVHYRRLHRFRQEHGRAVPIIASDAHSPTKVFRAAAYVPHLKLPPLSGALKTQELFNEIRRALRYGETRFSSTSYSPAQYWISGIEVTRDAGDAAAFWPQSEGTGVGHFRLPFSRNLNTLIGGRGSGKSATIEAIAFVAEPDVFTTEGSKKLQERSDFYGRASATLAGCRVKICWQFSGGDIAKDLPKRALVAERYFDPQHKHASVEYADAEDKQLVPQQIPPHPIQIFRLGEIEKQAGPDRLRSLFDQICGPEILELDAEVSDHVSELEAQRKSICELAASIRELVRDGSALRDYAKRMLLYRSVNTDALKTAYEQVDQLEEAGAILANVEEAVAEHLPASNLEGIREGIARLCEAVNVAARRGDGTAKPHLEELLDLVVAADEEKPPCQVRIEGLIGQVESETRSLIDAIAVIKSRIEAQLVSAKNDLAAQGLPVGAKDREAKRSALAESEAALVEYRSLLTEWNTALAKRKNLQDSLSSLSQRRSELRRKTGESITQRLKADLDESIIRIEADAQAASDKRAFRSWLGTNFRGNDFKFQAERCDALVQDGLTPNVLRSLLMNEGGTAEGVLRISRPTASQGEIDADNAKKLADRCKAVWTLPSEQSRENVDPAAWDELPAEVQNGLICFPEDSRVLDQALMLDEIIFDDVPQIRLNDRPADARATARPVDELSPGQRCSAILPILLLTGDSPLIIDQPEDNLDNRLIRQVIVNILASIKLRRQVIIATHNPNLPVLGDVESAVVLQGVGDKQCEVVQRGDLDTPALAHQLTEVMEGGREAFQYRHVIYAAHWDGPIEA